MLGGITYLTEATNEEEEAKDEGAMATTAKDRELEMSLGLG